MFKVWGSIVTACFLLMSPNAHATLITYTGPIMTGSGQVKATADITYVGAGTYQLGSGLNSYTLQAYDSVPSLVMSLSVPSSGITPVSPSSSHFLTIDGSGLVTDWFLFADDSVSNILTSSTASEHEDSWSNGDLGLSDEFLGQGPSPILWSGVPVDGGQIPEPGSLALLGVGLVVLATARRRQPKAV